MTGGRRPTKGQTVNPTTVKKNARLVQNNTVVLYEHTSMCAVRAWRMMHAHHQKLAIVIVKNDQKCQNAKTARASFFF